MVLEQWEDVPLGEATLKIGSGATPRGGKSVYVDDGTAFIRSQNVYDNRFSPEGLVYINDDAARALNGVTVESGDVLIDITGESVTRTCIAPPECLPARVSQHVAIIRPNQEKLDSRFLTATLLSPPVKAYLNLLSQAGATRRALTKRHLQELVIALPPLVEQRRIAVVLGALGDLIDTDHRVASTASRLATALCVNASSNVPLRVLAHVVATKQFQPCGMVDHYSIPVYDSSRLPEQVDGSTIKSAKQRLTTPSVLVSRLNPQTMRVWMAYPSEGITSGASTEFVVLGPCDGVAAEEVWAVCSAPTFQDQMLARVTGTTGSHQRVDKAALASLLVSDVTQLSAETRAAVVSLVQEAHESLVAAQDLSLARDELLSLILSGAIRVDEVAA